LTDPSHTPTDQQFSEGPGFFPSSEGTFACEKGWIISKNGGKETKTMEQMLNGMRTGIMKGEASRVRQLVQACIDQGLDPEWIMEEGMIAAMDVIGERFKKDEIFMPEVMIAARAMNAGLQVLEPVLIETGVKAKGKMVLASVRGDLHDIGKNMVSMMFRGAGFTVVDLGVDVPEDTIVKAVQEHRPDIVGLSSLLTMTLPHMKTTIEAIEEAGLRQEVFVMVGGAPVTQDYADGIGADGYAPDSASAVDRARELMAGRAK
jgi:5-methyltetrahydrofolate--homocysteine methyltransferase